MIKTDKIRKPQPVLLYIIDYLWSGFTGLSVAMMVVALWAWGSAVFGEFMLPAPADVFQKALELLDHFQQNEIGISLWRSVVGITIALVAGLAAGLIAGSFKTAMALLKPVITILLAMPPIIWVVMALFWFGFGNPSVLFTIIVLVAPPWVWQVSTNNMKNCLMRTNSDCGRKSAICMFPISQAM